MYCVDISNNSMLHTIADFLLAKSLSAKFITYAKGIYCNSSNRTIKVKRYP